MKKLTLQVLPDEEEPVLLLEQIFNDTGVLVSERDYQTDPPTEKLLQYNNAGQLILEMESAGNEALNRTTYAYNEGGSLVEICRFVGDELYEQVQTQFRNDGFTEVTTQSGHEVMRVEHYQGDTSLLIRTIESGVVRQYSSSEYVAESQTEITKVYSHDNVLLSVEKMLYDNFDRIIDQQEFDSEENLLASTQSVYEGDLLLKLTHRDYKDSIIERETSYEYDEHKNMVRSETKSFSGKVLEYMLLQYDNQNRLLEDQGLDFHGPYHLRYEYED